MPIWREKAPNHPSKDIGRSWADGEGHVGHAFHNRVEIIHADVQEGGVGDMMTPADKRKPYDAEVYRSYISWPILPRDPARPVLGVVVATSDIHGRFDRANARVVNHAAVALATVIETAYDSP